MFQHHKAHLNQKLTRDHAYKPKSFAIGDLWGPKMGQILLTKFFRQGDKTSWQNEQIEKNIFSSRRYSLLNLDLLSSPISLM